MFAFGFFWHIRLCFGVFVINMRLCVCPKFVSQGKVWPWLTSQTITHNFDYTNYLILNGVTITPRLHCGIFKGYSNYSLYWKSSRNVLNAYKGMSIIFCSYLGDVSTILLFGSLLEMNWMLMRECLFYCIPFPPSIPLFFRRNTYSFIQEERN